MIRRLLSAIRQRIACRRGEHIWVETWAQVCRPVTYPGEGNDPPITFPVTKSERWKRCARCGKPAPDSEFKAWLRPTDGAF